MQLPSPASSGQQNSNLDSILVIIPVLNEAATLANVIHSLQQLGLTHIRVVDNGSDDNSVAIAQTAGAEVILEPIAGYGRACWRGLQNLSPDIEWILFCDGDGSDDLTELPQFFEAMSKADFILGNRRASVMGRSAMTPVQNFGNSLATQLIDWGWGYRYHDLGPLRLIRRSALEVIEMQDRGFGWTVEMQARAVELGLTIAEIPVNYRRRQGGRSKISGTLSGSLQAGTIILMTLGKLYGKNQSQFLLKSFSSFFLLLGCLWIMPHGDFRFPENFQPFCMGVVLMGLGFILSWKIKEINRVWFWAVALLSRLFLLPMYPGDDIWRYLWEGRIQNLGFSPYHFPPNATELIPYRTVWWSQINHLDTSAIYPPFTQLGFRLLATISASVLLFKLAFAIADLITCYLLSRRFNSTKTLTYAWNPLILYSFAGAGHYDSWFILPLVAAWLTYDKNRWSWSVFFLGISIAVKWISLPILGLIAWFKLPKLKTSISIFFIGILPLLLSAIPFCSATECSLIPTSSTFVSHGRSAEFIPYIVKQFWQYSTQSNSIYAIPLIAVLLGVIIRYPPQKDFNQSDAFLQSSQTYFIALLALSPIIHAWYFTWFIPFAVATQNLGIRLVSLSAFVYFVLPYRQGLGHLNWNLTDVERWLLWLPFIVGIIITIWQSKIKFSALKSK
ncbi:MAG: glycosyltransferase family 2 protein [Microcoleaceae cyanobacterium]